MDPCVEDKIIKIGKCLDEEEKKKYAEFLHEFSEIFSWIF